MGCFGAMQFLMRDASHERDDCYSKVLHERAAQLPPGQAPSCSPSSAKYKIKVETPAACPKPAVLCQRGRAKSGIAILPMAAMDQVDGNRAGDGKHLPRSPSSVLEKLALEEAEALEVLRLSDHGDEPEEPRADEAGEASRENPPAAEENVSAASPSLPAPPRPLRSQLPAYAHRQGGGSPAGAGHGQGDWHPHQNGPVSPVYFVPQFDAYGPEASLGSPGAPAITHALHCALPACTGVGACPSGRRWHRLRAPAQRAHLPPAPGGAEIFSNWRPRGMPAPVSPAAGPPSPCGGPASGLQGREGAHP